MKSSSLPPEVSEMTEQLTEAIQDWETFIPKPNHTDLVEVWKNDFKQYISDLYNAGGDFDVRLIDDIVGGLLDAHDLWIAPRHTEPVAHEDTHALMNRPQTTQRSESWYEQFKSQLTASEFSKITSAPRERGTLVLQKAGKIDISARQAHVPTYRQQMVAFDWGICLEPVVKQLLEEEWSAVIQDVGRFNHPTDTRLAASPDGLILKCDKFPERAGHLLEIKCPKSRKIGVKIPLEYFYQMQLQMEVTGVRSCEYVEVKFDFVGEEEAASKITPGVKFGKAVLVGCFCDEKQEWLPCKYVYGPTCDMAWKPELGLNEQTLETNVWIHQGWHHETVHRDEAWFASLRPKIDAFWDDVAAARRDEFVMPESSRKRKEKVNECLLVESDDESKHKKPEE